MEKAGFNGFQIGVIYSLLPLGCIFAPIIGGQLADRHIPTQVLLGGSHSIGGLLLCAMARIHSYAYMVLVLFLWALIYAPTFAFTNAITFRHLKDADKRFGLVRVFGTFGWVAAGFSLTAIRKVWPESNGWWGGGGMDSFWLAGAASMVLAGFSFTLPKTSPAKTGASPYAFLQTVKLLRNPSFAIFAAFVAIFSTEVIFFYELTARFLKDLNVSSANIPTAMTLAQLGEIGGLVALPTVVRHLGIRRTMLVGALVWPIRYFVFSFGRPTWLVIAAITLHGICFVFFSLVSFAYVDSMVSDDIRTSAQSLVVFLTSGIGMYFGAIFAGWLTNYYTVGTAMGPVVDFLGIFFLLSILTSVFAFAFVFLSKKEQRPV
jgi:MFS family permease